MSPQDEPAYQPMKKANTLSEKKPEPVRDQESVVNKSRSVYTESQTDESPSTNLMTHETIPKQKLKPATRKEEQGTCKPQVSETSSEESEESESSDDEFQPLIASNGLVYSFLPLKTAEKLLSQPNNQKIIIKGIEETETILAKELERPNKEFKHHVVDFMSKICSLIHIPNFKICLTCLRIVHKLVSHSAKTICKSINDLEKLIETLISKLVDNKVVI